MSPLGAGRVPISPALAEAIAAVRRGRSYERYRKSASKSTHSFSDEERSGEEESQNIVDNRSQRRDRISWSDSSSSSSPPRASRYLRNKRKSLEAKSLSPSPAHKEDHNKNQVSRSGRRQSTSSSSPSPKAERKSRRRPGVQPKMTEAQHNSTSLSTHNPNATSANTQANTSPKLAEPPANHTKRDSHNRAAFFPAERCASPSQKTKPRKGEEKHQNTSISPRVRQLSEPLSGESPPPFGLYYETQTRTPSRTPGSCRPRLPSPPSPEPSTPPSARKGSGQNSYAWGVLEGTYSGGNMDEVIAAADFGRFCFVYLRDNLLYYT
jgi:hypothetical protein